MSQTISVATGKPYGVERVCRAWEQARSTFYAHQQPVEQPTAAPPRRRGPPPLVPDDVLLEHIRQDLANSPFCGEGHRKVWARLRFGQGLQVSRKRVLRLMREHHLLSPFRVRQAEPKRHDRSISTAAPNLMWGTDGAKVFTLEDGWVWVFIAVEHWNAECVGWHVSKRGDRFTALEPISQGLTNLFGSVAADVARGLHLRMDHGSQYLSDHFVNQVRFWGVTPSFAFVAEPETNGVAERFIRTLKEQAIYGRAFRSVAEVRAAVADFVQRYNEHWRVEKNRFVSPKRARENWLAQATLRAAA
jgi:transposase InsO family protein